MKVTLLNSTQGARDLLIFTKNTRLKMSADSMLHCSNMSDEEKQEELDYMVNTIKSSWEFVDFTFMIEGVTRAFTHQFVRNRQGSYAQQTMRILDVDGFEYTTGPSIKTPEQQWLYDKTMMEINSAYNLLIKSGVSIEDARGVLPTNIQTNIVAKFNLRTLSDMMASRSSSRTQGEFREVIELMYQAVIAEKPWCVPFLRDAKTVACNELESVINNSFEGCDDHTKYIKLIDKIRTAK